MSNPGDFAAILAAIEEEERRQKNQGGIRRNKPIFMAPGGSPSDPIFVSAEIGNVNGYTVVITWNQTITSIPAVVIQVNGVTQTISSQSSLGSTTSHVIPVLWHGSGDTVTANGNAVTNNIAWVALLDLQADIGVTETGGRVSTWSDQSGSGNHFTQSTAISRPTKVSTGGYPAVYFAGQNGDSVAEYMTASPFADNLPKFAVLIVSKFDTVAQWSAPIIEKMEYIVIGDILKGWKVQTTTDGAGDTTAKLNMQNPANDVLAVYKISNNTNFLVSSLEYLGSTGHAYINGSNTGESIAGAVAAGTFANAADVILCADIFDLPSSGWSGWLRSVMVYQITSTAKWDATDRAALETRLGARYGLTVP